MQQHFSTALRVINSTKVSKTVWIEPIGEELEFPAGASWLVVCDTTQAPANPFEIEFDEDSVTIYVHIRGKTKITQGVDIVWDCEI